MTELGPVMSHLYTLFVTLNVLNSRICPKSLGPIDALIESQRELSMKCRNNEQSHAERAFNFRETLIYRPTPR